MISIIIPVLNEQNYLAECLSSLSRAGCEVIVVDGGSIDDTVAIAESFGATVLRLGIANRARQMNAGAEAARGEVLLFFHADSRLPESGADSIRQAMEDPEMIGGSFALGFYPSQPFYSFLAATSNIFCRMTRMIFGDRGIFIQADHFRRIGKFPETVIMEDAALATAMRRSGKIIILPEVVTTSARKYVNETKIQALYRTVWAYAAYRLGVPAEKIKAGYYRLNRSRP